MVQQQMATSTATGTTLVEVKGLKVHFPIKGGLFNRTIAHVKAVDGVDLTIRRGETLGLVGRAAAASQRQDERFCSSSSPLGGVSS